MVRITPEEFDKMFAVMDEAFPNSEMRDREGQRALFDHPFYSVVGKKDENDELLLFLAQWEFPDFLYVEHLAVSKAARGSGIGSHFLSQYLKNAKKPVYLEVEPPELSDMAKRRIGFYERLGLTLNPFPYLQPPLRPGDDFSPLLIMSYPGPISESEFLPLKEQIYREVFGREL